MIDLFVENEDCCGCTACMSICPMQAITMQPDIEGFLYPVINRESCIKCGMCKKVCAFQNGYATPRNFNDPVVYAVKHKSDDVRYVSSSGGMFTVLSDEILACGGTVYGVGFDEKMVVCHQRAEDQKHRDKFRGSKYVQSELRITFNELAIDLRAGRKVLFTGTPCQAAGLKEYLSQARIDANELVLCDIVCHGTPSPLIFANYLEFRVAKKGKNIANHVFRSKIKGWRAHTEINVFEDGQEDYKSYLSQLYKNIFYSHVALRPACHNCKYTNMRRPSDITIADFRGIEKTMPEFDDNRGISLVLINTHKGQELLEKVKVGIELRQSCLDACLQRNLQEPSKPSPKRNIFWKDYQANGFEYVIKKYFGYDLIGKIKHRIKELIPPPVESLIKKFIIRG